MNRIVTTIACVGVAAGVVVACGSDKRSGFSDPAESISGTFDEYWNGRGKNLRANMKKQRDKLATQGVATRMEILDTAKDIERGVREYAMLESKGWKAEGGTAVSEHHPQTRFYREMLERFALQNQARIYRYFFGEQLVASEFCLCADGEFVILKTIFRGR